MKFIVDAQLPRRLCVSLGEFGHDAKRTLDLREGNRTADPDLCSLADAEARGLVSKDGDFVNSHLRSGQPAKLLLISTGNIDNDSLLKLLEQGLPVINESFETCSFIELSRFAVIVHY